MKLFKVLAILAAPTVLLISIGAGKPPNIKRDFVRFEYVSYSSKKNVLYFSKHEVTNNEYNEFLSDLKAKSQTDYLENLIDSSQWKIKFPNSSYSEILSNAYHTHPGYGDYPVVNITLESAKRYCEWLTDCYNKNSKKQFSKVRFRLPSESEWQMIANPLPGHNLPWYGNFPYTDDGKTIRANIKIKDAISGGANYIFDKGLVTLKAGQYLPNNLGIFDIIGNVSEMTDEGNLKGGSWDSFIEESSIEKSQTYSLPDPRVGFRVIMEVIE